MFFSFSFLFWLSFPPSSHFVLIFFLVFFEHQQLVFETILSQLLLRFGFLQLLNKFFARPLWKVWQGKNQKEAAACWYWSAAKQNRSWTNMDVRREHHRSTPNYCAFHTGDTWLLFTPHVSTEKLTSDRLSAFFSFFVWFYVRNDKDHEIGGDFSGSESGIVRPLHLSN